MMSEPRPHERLLTTQEVADILAKKKRTVEGWRNAKRAKGLPYVRVGRDIRYRPADVTAFIETNLTQPGA